MTRSEHVEWAKKRALEYIDNGGDISGAWSSMASDLSKHSETSNHAGLQLGMMMLMGGHLSDVPKMRKFIEGFH